MNTRLLLLFGLGVFALARAERGEFSFATALPAKKNAIEVTLHRNPFQMAASPDKPLPVLRDKDDPALKLPVLLNGHIRSVLRQPKPLVLIDASVFQPGDEVKLAHGALLPKFRVVLKAVQGEQLVFQVTSLDPQHPGQIDSVVPLSFELRSN